MRPQATNARAARRLLLCTALVLTCLVAAIPATAGQKQRAGDRINVLLGTPTTFPADRPFHVAHGWTLNPDSTDHDAIGRYGFRLEVDGRPVGADFVERAAVGDQLTRLWVHNVPSGLPAGTHSFTGYWLGPCQRLVESGYTPYPDPTCERPTEVKIANGPLTRWVEFTP